MVFTLYDNDLVPKLTTKVRNKHEDKAESRKATQKEWYKRRGCFLNYRRRIAKKLSIDIKEFADIQSVEALENWCRDYILKTSSIDIKDNCVPYVIYMYPKAVLV